MFSTISRKYQTQGNEICVPDTLLTLKLVYTVLEDEALIVQLPEYILSNSRIQELSQHSVKCKD